MKTIKCDLCKGEFGKTVNVGHFQAITLSKYCPAEIGGGFYVNSQRVITDDICNTCSDKICEAQNKVVEEILQANLINLEINK